MTLYCVFFARNMNASSSRIDCMFLLLLRFLDMSQTLLFRSKLLWRISSSRKIKAWLFCDHAILRIWFFFIEIIVIAMFWQKDLCIRVNLKIKKKKVYESSVFVVCYFELFVTFEWTVKMLYVCFQHSRLCFMSKKICFQRNKACCVSKKRT